MNATTLEDLLALLPPPTRARMASLYLDLLGPTFEAIGRALPSSDAAVPLHRLAGGAAMLQDQPVAQLARSMERALLDGDGALALASWPALQAAASRSRAALATS